MQFDRLKRREFMTLLGSATAWPLASRLGTAETVRRVGILDPRAAGGYSDQHYWSAFREQMRALGYIEGSTVAFDVRWANGDVARLAPLTAELVSRRVSIIVALATPAAQAAKRVTTEVPIVVP